MDRIQSLHTARAQRGVLIAAHRGMVGGNIPHNSEPAFETALFQGTDILETDVIMCADGTIFIFHPGQEKNHLKMDIEIPKLDAAQVRQLRYVNSCNAVTDYGILSLDEFLERYKNRCLINLDHGWDFLPALIEGVRRHAMEDQILLKAPADLKYARVMEELAPDMMFMPICKETDTITEALEQMDLNFTGVEVVFARDDSPLASEDYIECQHRAGRLLWCNAILYNYKKQLSGGHTDDVSVTGDPDSGWGWLIRRGYDIIQTDWVQLLRLYMDNL